jgi:hypothetical protein
MSRPFGSKNKKTLAAQQNQMGVEGSLHFNERDYQNFGKFTPFIVEYGHAMTDADIRVNEYARKDLVNQSRYYAANLNEVESAFQRLADFTVGNALVPLYNGKNQDWANSIKTKYLRKTLNNLTRLGIIADWQTLWQTVLKCTLEDGDILIIPFRDRYGMPKVDIIEGHRISNRDGTSIIKKGVFANYKVEDGVIYDSNGNVKGYSIIGETPDDDYTISSANAFLVYSPFSFKKGRGLPILSSAARSARNLMDYQHYVPQIVKQEARVQLVETNQEGRAPISRTAFSQYNQSLPINPAPGSINSNGAAVNAVTEYTQGGVYYLKSNGGKLESFNSGRPTHEVQSYVTNTQKEMLCGLFPHQLLLSPETVGGPGARGLKEILVASINTHRAMIEKAALLVLQYVLSVGMTNTTLQTTFDFTNNFDEDWTDWSFTKAPELVIDAGQERAADLADFKAGIKSPDEIVAKEGRNYDDVLREILNSSNKKAEMILQFQKQYPTLAAYAPQMFGLVEQPLPPIPQPLPISDNKKDNTTK